MAVKTIQIDGSSFNDLNSFYDEIQLKFAPNFPDMGRNLDAFNDVMLGGFGVFNPGETVKIIWKNSAKSRQDLGPELYDEVIEIIQDQTHIKLILN
jgi:RNAse (barnase) inhibitor barstar